MDTTTHQASKTSATTSRFADWKQLISAGTLDNMEFWGEVKEGRLVPQGLLADQHALDDIPVGIYVIEQDGTLVGFNKTAASTWGRTPLLNRTEKHCGAHVLRYPSGELMSHEHAPPSVVVKHGATVRNADVICEQPNGKRVLALMNIFPIRSAQGELIGAVNVFRHNTMKSVPGIAEN